MELISQHTKKIMEDCKVKAREAGLVFSNDTLEYIVTNRDLLRLAPKYMIPTLYDYWVHDVEVLKEEGKYKIYPHNPYETVINTRPPVSFYNDNNPDWLNIMIFYHVLAHIDFFQNNLFFRNTWNDDFMGQALADKRLIESLRSQYGRWVDYAIEFSRSIDNLVGYYELLAKSDLTRELNASPKLEYYFDIFLQEIAGEPISFYYKEVERFNDLVEKYKDKAETLFFSDIKKKFPEFESLFNDYINKPKYYCADVMQFIMDNSPFLKKEKNKWIISVMDVVRNTSLYFQPQIRTKICNEGWASYWHDVLFRNDERIKGHEVAYARINAGVTSISRVGLNPYAIGLRLLEYIEELANKGKISYEYQKIENIEEREKYDKKTNKGKEALFEVRRKFSDFTLINTFVDQDFVDKYNLFVVGQRYNEQKGVIEYYVKSRKAQDYKEMLINNLYHPPKITVNLRKTNERQLYLEHHFEGKQLYKDYIAETMMGIEYLWGGEVHLETTEILVKRSQNTEEKPEREYRRVIYTMNNRKLSKEIPKKQ